MIDDAWVQCWLVGRPATCPHRSRVSGWCLDGCLDLISDLVNLRLCKSNQGLGLKYVIGPTWSLSALIHMYNDCLCMYSS